MFAGGYYITRRCKYSTLEKLVKHYSQAADGLCYRLTILYPKIETQATVDPSNKFRDEWEIERRYLQFKRKLGNGKYGEVWEGLWNGTTPVAIKIPKPGSINNEITLAEAQILKKLHHQNVIQLYAVCSIDEPVYVITELMKNGNLQDYLQKGEGHHMALLQLMDIASQVAAGMTYLEERKCIHRDLCARNILVSEWCIVKLANFGMARVLKDDTYRSPKGEKIPVVWTNPTVLLSSIYTNKSDIWSFGIFLTELVTHGRHPYPGMTNGEVLARTEAGYRMPPPPGCPDPLYQIMLDCWKLDTKEIPTFKVLKDQLDNLCMLYSTSVTDKTN